MPDSKITALTSTGTGTDPAVDPLVIVDVSDTTMAATGTTKKVTLNQLLACSPTATLASATITGDLTVDTSTLKVDSANNRVGIGTASPSNACQIQGTGQATVTPTVIGDQSALSLIDSAGLGNNGGMLVLGASVASGMIGQVAIKSLLSDGTQNGTANLAVFTRGATSDSTLTERYRIAANGIATWSNVGGVAGTAMTLNATGLGVGVSPVEKLTIAGRGLFITANPDNAAIKLEASTGTNAVAINFRNTGGNYFVGVDNSAGGRLFGVPYSLCVGSEGAYPVVIATNNIARLTVDTTGNVGIGVTPKSWASGYRALQLGIYSALTDAQGGATYLTNNAFFDSVDSRWEYITNNRVVRYDQDTADGGHKWYSVASGAVNAAITWGNPLMTLDASGNLILLSSNTPAALTTNGQLTVNATSNTNLRFSYRGSDGVTRVANITLA